MNTRLPQTVLKLLGCLIFDIAVILAFFHIFALFALLATVKSIFFLLFLLLGLATLNGAVAFPRMISSKMGVPCSASIIILSILYAVMSNVLSVLFLVGDTVVYVVWELILLAVFAGLLSLFLSYGKKASDSMHQAEEEQFAKVQTNLLLIKIEAAINSAENENAAVRITYNAMKERMNASTPFGRITGNPAVSEIEGTINMNLENLLSGITPDMDEKALASIQKLMDHTRQLLINREKLIVQ